MKKKVRLVMLWVVLLAVLGMVAPTPPEAMAVPFCGSVCTTLDDCNKKCACETPEWGTRVTFCSNCPWVPNNPCAW